VIDCVFTVQCQPHAWEEGKALLDCARAKHKKNRERHVANGCLIIMLLGVSDDESGFDRIVLIIFSCPALSHSHPRAFVS
jgi:hypothetical protein